MTRKAETADGQQLIIPASRKEGHTCDKPEENGIL